MSDTKIKLGALSDALTGLIRALHENKIIDQETVLQSLERGAIAQGVANHQQERSLTLARYIRSLREAFPAD
jgi:hypothetical protein